MPTMLSQPSARALSSCGDGIGGADVGVADELGLATVAMGEERQEEPSDGVIAEVGRDESDPQFPVGVAVVGVGLDLRGQRRGELRGPAAMLGQERLGIVIGMKVGGEQEVARGRGVIGLLLEGVPEAGECLIEPPLILEDVAQVVVRLGMIGLELDGTAEGGERLVEPARVAARRCPGCCGPRQSRA